MTRHSTLRHVGIAAPDLSLYLGHVEFKQKAYSAALEGAGFDAVLIAGGGMEFRFMDDQFHPFKPNSFAAEWLPLEDRMNHYVLVKADGTRPKVFFPDVEDVWHTQIPPIDEEISAHYEWVGYREKTELKNSLPHASCCFIGPSQCAPENVELEINPPSLIHRLDWHRAYKSQWEVFCLRQANALGSIAHKAVRDAFFRGPISEYDLHMIYLEALGVEQRELPYATIMALNENAAVLHHLVLSKIAPKLTRTFLIDAGASYRGYGSDISRTYCTDGSVFEDLLQAFQSMQQAFVAQIEPGLSFADLNRASQLKVSQLMVDFGFLDCSAEACVEEGLIGSFYPHGLGHLLGIQVHDRGGHCVSDKGDIADASDGSARMIRQIEEGQVFTIEPGLYFIPMLLEKIKTDKRAALLKWDLIEPMLPYGGMRIEDNIHMSADGPENLTRAYL